MNITYHSFLSQLLEAITYEGDKEKFVNDFVKNIELETFLNLIESLPQEKQVTIKEKLNTAEKPEEIQELLLSNFEEKQRQEAFDKVAQAEIKEFLESLKETLTDDQRQNVVQLLKKVSQETPKK